MTRAGRLLQSSVIGVFPDTPQKLTEQLLGINVCECRQFTALMRSSFLMVANVNDAILSVVETPGPVDAGIEMGRRIHKDKRKPVDAK
jgi:hypothetical protein